MRWGLMVGVFAIAGCAGSQLASTPPPGVDLSGHWNLNLADSDDAQRLMQSQIAAATAGVNAGGSTGAGGGRQRGRGGMPAGPTGPVMPSVAVLDESLRWPGHDLTIEQASDRVTFTADGVSAADEDVRVTGSLTVRGRSRPASFDAKVSTAEGEVWLDGELRVNRADFGLTWNWMGIASMDNTILIHAVFTRQ